MFTKLRKPKSKVVEPKLTVELIPRALWGESLAKRYRTQWDKLRVVAYAKAGHVCEICGGIGNRGSAKNPGALQAHEVWEYVIDGRNAVQRLVRLIALCPDCHSCKHMGRSFNVLSPEAFRRLQEHFKHVNGMTDDQMAIYQEGVFEQWRYYNDLRWTQDLSLFFTVNSK